MSVCLSNIVMCCNNKCLFQKIMDNAGLNLRILRECGSNSFKMFTFAPCYITDEIMKVKLLILFLILIGHFAEADATRPLRKFFPVRQSDGSVIDVCKQGNGRFVFYSTRCGIALVRGENGDLEYAKKASDGLSATGIMASESDNHFVLGKALRGADKISIVEKEHSTDILSTNEAYEWMSTQ